MPIQSRPLDTLPYLRRLNREHRSEDGVILHYDPALRDLCQWSWYAPNPESHRAFQLFMCCFFKAHSEWEASDSGEPSRLPRNL